MVDRKSFVIRAGIAALSAVFAAIAALSWGPIARAQAPDANPTAEAVLKKSTDFLKKAKSLTVDAVREQKVATFTIKMPFSMAIERPNRFLIRSKPDNLAAIAVTLVSDGKTLSTTINQLKKYTETDAPESIDDLEANPVVNGVLVGMMITDLFSTDPYTALMDGVKTANYSGSEQLGGVKVHHLSLSKDQVDSEIWIAAEGDPLIQKIRIEPTRAMARVPGQNAMKNLDVVTTFKNWQFDRPIAADTFVFKAPAGSQKVDSLFGELGGGDAKPERSPLLGKAAPKLQLKLLDGGAFQLEDHRDKEIVMMDFWATWCGPCVVELPILADVAKAYKDKGVVFRAVNLQEEPGKIREFLKSKKLEITVALDSTGQTGSAYKAEAIPMLVLIDKKGIVQSVHVGYNPSIKRALKKELDALLAGKDLAQAAEGGATTAKP
jgi:peroxiredoxin